MKVWVVIMSTVDLYSQHIFTAIKMIGDSSGQSYVILDAREKTFPIIECNELYEQKIGGTISEIVGKSFVSLLAPASEQIDFQIAAQKVSTTEWYHLHLTKQAFVAELTCTPFQDEQRGPLYILVLIRDITYTRAELAIDKIEKQLFEAIEQGRSIEQKLAIICREIDAFFHPLTFTVFLLPSNNETLLSIHAANLAADHEEVHFSTHTATTLYQQVLMEGNPMPVSIQGTDGLIEEHRQYALNKGMDSCYLFPIVNSGNNVIGVFSVYFIYTEGTQANFALLKEKVSSLVSLAYMYSVSQKRIDELARTDITTGLANYSQFIEIVDAAIVSGKTGYIKILEPGEFANVVELYGRSMGDQLLQQIANRFNSLHDMKDVYIARFSSSTLAICRIMKKDEREYNRYNERIRKLLHTPYLLENQKVYITLKTGIAPFDEVANTKEVIRNAETALSYARKQVGTFTAMYSEEQSKEIERQMSIINHLNIALQRQELTVHLQPKISLRNGKISSIEALVRWNSPELGFVSPADFLPAAESVGKIREVDNIVIKKVLEWIQQRQRSGRKPYRIAVNISPEHFYYEHFVEELYELVASYYVDPREIIIEVTENTGLVDLQKAIEIMRELKRRGFDISVDDFGIGYSSLSYLQKLPFSELKLDRSFINKIHEAGTEAVVRSIIQLAHALEMDVVAEGIETDEQRSKLKELGCKIGQGYLFHKPMPLQEVDLLLQ